MLEEPFDVLFVTALGIEARAISEHLRGTSQRQVGEGIQVDVGTLPDGNGGGLAAVAEVGRGNVAASITTTRIMESVPVSTVIVVGVAGGIKDVEIGDVVASSKVYWIEGGKDGKEFASRPDFAPVDESLVQCARSVARSGDWRERANAPGAGQRLGGGSSVGLIEPVAVSEKVISSSDSHMAQVIQERFSDAVAVEMEGMGVMRSVSEQSGARGIVIRGISDLLDSKSQAEERGSQAVAATNAAGFAVEVAVRAVGEAANQRPGLSRSEMRKLWELLSELYPKGPTERHVWDRAGGDIAALSLKSSGATAWWEALRTLRRGGGGATISLSKLLSTVREDWPNNDELPKFQKG